jgi:hypothetical protein
MLKNCLLTGVLFCVCAFAIFSCQKRPPLTGCVGNFSGVQVELNNLAFKSDSNSVIFDTLNNRFTFFSRDIIRGANLFISVYAPIQDFDIPITNKDSFGTAQAVAFINGVSNKADFGNIAVNVNRNARTICGQFFFYNKATNLVANQGEFKAVSYKYQ